MYRKLGSYKGDSTLGTWLYRIAVNVSLNKVSAKQPQTEPIDARPHLDSRAVDPGAELIRGERAAQVRAAIACLPKKQRATVILRVYHELSHEEIAGVLGSSVGAVKNLRSPADRSSELSGREKSTLRSRVMKRLVIST